MVRLSLLKRAQSAPQLLALIDQAFLSVGTFGTSAIIGRAAGLDALGTFTIAWMVVLFVNGLQNALVIAPMLSLSPSEAHERTQYYGHFFASELRFILSICAVGMGCWLVIAYFSPSVASLVPYLSVTTVAFQISDFVRRYAHVLGKSTYAVIQSVSSTSLQIAILIGFGIAGSLTTARALVTISATLLFTSTAVLVALRSWPERVVRNPAVGQRQWNSARWLVPSGLMQWTCGNLFVVAAPAYLGISAVGAMRASQTLMGIINIWYQGLENVMPIRAGRLCRDAGVQHAVRYVVRMAAIWGGATGVVIVLASVYARELLQFVYGPDAAEYYWVLRWYAALNALMFLGLPVRSLLRALEQTGGIFGGFLAASIFSIVAVVPLLSRFGLSGAVFGLIGAQAVFQGVLMFNAYRCVRDRTPQSGELLTAPI